MKLKKTALLLLVAAPLVLAGCNPTETSSSSTDNPSSSTEEPLLVTEAFEGATYSASGAVDYSCLDNGVQGGISGVKSFVGESVETRTDILGTLEKYAVDNAITGLPLFENGGKVMYSARIQPKATEYVTGYGWGILREGNATGPLDHTVEGKPSTVLNPSYYHTVEADDPGTLLYLNADGSVVSDLNSYVAGGYFGTKLNSTADGYDWYGYLSTKDRPYAVFEDQAGTRYAFDVSGDGEIDIGGEVMSKSNVTSTIWRVYVRTGSEGGAQYRTNSTDPDRKAFDKKNVELEDYVNAFKILLCGKYAYYRGNEQAGQTGQQSIVGAAEYYKATANTQWDSEIATAAFENVGIKSGHDATGDFIDIQLGAPANRFYAMYNISSSLYSPINGDFFNLVTNNGANPLYYQSFNNDKSKTPVDNTLAVGPYFLESWDSGQNFAFAKNPLWWECVEEEGIYNFPGVNVAVLPAINTDPEASFKQFLAGQLDAAVIPSTQIKNYGNHPLARKVTGDSVFKLNVNSCTQEQSEALFGPNGSVSPHTTPRQVHPWMSNKDFIKGMFYSLDREAIAETTNNIPAIDYFSSNYMSDPEGGVSYNTTDQHAAALTDFWGDTIENYGYGISSSQSSFDAAVTAMLADRTIKAGDTLEIETWWQTESNIDVYGVIIEGYIEDAFNKSSVAKANNITLDLKNYAPSVWSDVYYKHLMTGDFDFGFGSISGNSLDPLNFMEVLKSNNSSGFTLNWGPDTSVLDLEFEEETYSFDLLWGAADHGVLAYRGMDIPALTLESTDVTVTDEGAVICSYSFKDAVTEMAERYLTNSDPDAAAVLASLGEETYVAPLYFALMDDASVDYEWCGHPDGLLLDFDPVTGEPIIAPYGMLLYASLEDLGFTTPTLEINAEGLSFVLTIPADLCTLMLEEAGYFDVYYMGQLSVAGNVTTAYQISEIYLG